MKRVKNDIERSKLEEVAGKLLDATPPIWQDMTDAGIRIWNEMLKERNRRAKIVRNKNGEIVVEDLDQIAVQTLALVIINTKPLSGMHARELALASVMSGIEKYCPPR